MNAGRAEQIGTPMEVYENPATQFVAGFIGSPSMNFLPGKGDGTGKVALEHGGIVRSRPGSLEPGRAVIVGIRPEHLDAVQSGRRASSPAPSRWSSSSAPTRWCTSRTAASTIDRATSRTATQPEVGSTLLVAADPARVYLFDAATGARIR